MSRGSRSRTPGCTDPPATCGPTHQATAYAASKGAILALTRSMASYYARFVTGTHLEVAGGWSVSG